MSHSKWITTLAGPILASLTLTGCMTYDPYTGEKIG